MTSHKRHVVSNHRSFHCLFSSLCGPTSTKHQSPHCWPFVRGIHRSPMKSPHKEPVTRKMHPFHDFIMSHTFSIRILRLLRMVCDAEGHWNITPIKQSFASLFIVAFPVYVLFSQLYKCPKCKLWYEENFFLTTDWCVKNCGLSFVPCSTLLWYWQYW